MDATRFLCGGSKPGSQMVLRFFSFCKRWAMTFLSVKLSTANFFNCDRQGTQQEAVVAAAQTPTVNDHAVCVLCLFDLDNNEPRTRQSFILPVYYAASCRLVCGLRIDVEGVRGEACLALSRGLRVLIRVQHDPIPPLPAGPYICRNGEQIHISGTCARQLPIGRGRPSRVPGTVVKYLSAVYRSEL